MSKKNKDYQYTRTYKERRKAKEIRFNLYLDDEKEAQLFNELSATENKKELIVSLLYEHFERTKYKGQ